MSKCLFNTGRHGVTVTSLSYMFQCLTILTVQKCFLMQSVTCWHSSALSVSRSKTEHLALLPPLCSCREHLLASSRLGNSCVLSLSSKDMLSSPATRLHCPPLDAFKDLNILFVLQSPELYTIFKARLNQC